MKIDRLLEPFEKSKNHYWYLFPRAFFPYKDRPDGIPGFHRFLELLLEHQKSEKAWNRDSELEVLIMLEDEGITPIWDDQEDYHAHYRNRINLAKKMGFILPDSNYPIILTEVGKKFITSKGDLRFDIIEHQLIKYQFSNPSFSTKYDDFSLFPFMFTISVILQTEYITRDEFILRLFISKSQDEKEEVIDWIMKYRIEMSKESARPVLLDNLNLEYSARMIMMTFALSPTLDIVDKKLILKDKDRARMLYSKSWPNLDLKDYDNIDRWIEYYGSFDKNFWPLLSSKEKELKKRHRKYISREEGDEHKSIKAHAIKNREKIFGKGAEFFKEEYYFASSDRANLIFSMPEGKFIAVEVEVDVGDNDIVGLLQAIKYKYMFPVQENIHFNQVEGMLIANVISKKIKEICQKYNIFYYEISTKENTFKIN